MKSKVSETTRTPKKSQVKEKALVVCEGCGEEFHPDDIIDGECMSCCLASDIEDQHYGN